MAAAEKTTCPRCAAASAADARFCAACGLRLAADEKVEGVAAPGAGRRRYTRLPPRHERPFGARSRPGEAEVTIERQVEQAWLPVEAVLVNVSRGGLGIVADEMLEVGARVRATLFAGDSIQAEGTVAYCASFDLFQGVPCYRCGVSFDRSQPRFVAALTGATSGVGYLISLGDVAAEQGDRLAARTWYQESLALCRELDDGARVPRLLESLALLAALDDAPADALRLAGAASALREQSGVAATPAQQARIDGALGAVQWRMDETKREGFWAEGREMNAARALAYALGEES